MSITAKLSTSSGPHGRKWASAVCGALGVIVLGSAAVYVSAVLFLLLNKVDPRHARWSSIVDYWEQYADDERHRKQLVGSIGVSGVAILVLVPASLIAASQRRRPLHGDARFANRAEIGRAGLLPSSRNGV